MFSNIKTTRANKEIVARLTKKLGLGAENIIARIALAYSLASEVKMNINLIGDGSGKEYSFKVLFGEYSDYYIAMIACHYNIYKTDKDIPKYIKMHIDHGLQCINTDIENKYSLLGTEFLIDQIERGLRLS